MRGSEVTARIWALDIDEDGHPWRAHLIVTCDLRPAGEVRTSACGQQFTQSSHPRGWWEIEGLPLQDHAIHCGLDGGPTGAPPDSLPRAVREP